MQIAVDSIDETKGCGVNVGYGKVTEAECEAGKNVGVSPAKYKYIQQIIEKDESYSVEELKYKSMKELRRLLNDVND